MCKLTQFQGASKLHSTMTTELPWFHTEGIEKFQEYVVTLGHFHLDKYRMTPNHRGCYFHAKAILELELDAFMTTLDVTNEKLGWKSVVSAHGLTPTKFKRLVQRMTRSAQRGTLLVTSILVEKIMKLPKKKVNSFTRYRVAK